VWRYVPEGSKNRLWQVACGYQDCSSEPLKIKGLASLGFHGRLYVAKISGRNWHCATTKIVCLHVNNLSFYSLTTTTMPPIRTRKSRARHFTPPLELTCSNGQIKTPQRSAILTAKLLAQELNIQIPQPLLYDLVGVPPRNQSRILATKQVRTLHN